MSQIETLLKERILVLDGAMGTMIQAYDFKEADFRAKRFKDHPVPLQGNNDLLTLTQPEAIKSIHAKYFQAGADIVETNTFSSTSIGMADYEMEDWVYELNYEAAKIAKEVAEDFTAKEPHKPRFVAGSIGPTNRTASMSPDVNDPGFRAVTFQDLVTAYKEQVEGLIAGGADILLVEGKYANKPKLPSLMGAECIAKVKKVGKNIRKFKLGDIVLPLVRDNWVEEKVVKENEIIKLPNLSLIHI